MDVTGGIEQNIVRLDVSVHDTLFVDVSQGAAQLGHPEPHRFFGEALASNVEAQISTVHQVNDDVPGIRA